MLSRKIGCITHLVFSLILLTVVLFFIYRWYPEPFFTSDGGWQGMRIAFGVDIVLGPFLTFLFYKPDKWGVKFDVLIILVLQFSALAYGIDLIYKNRPVAIIFSGDRFFTLSAELVAEAKIDVDKFRTAKDQNFPIPIYMDLPEDKKRLLKFKLGAMSHGSIVYYLTSFYQKYDEKALCNVKRRSADLDFLAMAYEETEVEMAKFLQAYGGSQYDYTYIPVHCKYQNGLMAIDKKSGKFLKILNIPVERE